MAIRLWNLEEAAAFLNVEARELRSLVTSGEIPCVPQGDRMMFDPEEVDTWYTTRMVRRLPVHHRENPRQAPPPEFFLEGYCRLELMDPALEGKTKPAVLRELTALAERAGLLYDPQEFLEGLRRREEAGSTAMAEGIALVHPMSRDEYTCVEPFLAIAHTRAPIHFGEENGTPTDLFFLICALDPREHLEILGKLCRLAAEGTFLQQLREAATPEEMLQAVHGK